MTKKRFVYYEHKGADYILENPNTDLDFIEMLGDCLDEKEIVNRLNGLYEENKKLEQQKERYKRLSEIREKEINNRILTINEFIDDYSDDYGIKNVLLDLFYSEVKEYDLSKKYMALKKENEQLKEQLEICKDARQAYKQDWKACVSYCDTYKDEIHTLKDNIQGLIEENKMLKNNVEKLSEYVRFLAKLDDYNYKKTYTKEHLE